MVSKFDHIYNSSAWKRIRERILTRDGYTCKLCYSKVDLIIHHKIPLSEGGSNNDDNLLTFCRQCHFAVEFSSAYGRVGSRLKAIGKDEIWFYHKLVELGVFRPPKAESTRHKLYHIDMGVIRHDCRLCHRLIDKMVKELLRNPKTIIPIDIIFT